MWSHSRNARDGLRADFTLIDEVFQVGQERLAVRVPVANEVLMDQQGRRAVADQMRNTVLDAAARAGLDRMLAEMAIDDNDLYFRLTTGDTHRNIPGVGAYAISHGYARGGLIAPAPRTPEELRQAHTELSLRGNAFFALGGTAEERVAAVRRMCACGDPVSPAWDHGEIECTYLDRDISEYVDEGRDDDDDED